MPSNSPLVKEESATVDLPRNNKEYGKKDYWDERFSKEESFDWLVGYDDVRDQIQPFLNPESSILIVGCGNATFSADLYDAGFKRITNIDYSEVVVGAMKNKHQKLRPEMEWLVMDMTDMSEFTDESFDVVIDKAAMDALMTQEEDVWNPAQSVVDASRRMCKHISRILKRPGGHHLHISFAQPHFRKLYLLGWHPSEGENEAVTGARREGGDGYSKEFGWTFRYETIAGAESDGCFHHFLYMMTIR